MLTADEHTTLRQEMADRLSNVRWSRASLHGAFNVVEDYYDAFMAAVGVMVDAETMPFIFHEDEKREMVQSWLQIRAVRERRR